MHRDFRSSPRSNWTSRIAAGYHPPMEEHSMERKDQDRPDVTAPGVKDPEREQPHAKPRKEEGDIERGPGEQRDDEMEKPQ
jgi:hypothetical protein